MKSSLALVITLFIFTSVSSAAGKTHDCGSTFLEGGQRFQYCIDRPEEGPVSGDIMYYFHGVFHSEQTWQADFADLRDEWADLGVPQPTVISISFGTFWLLSESKGLYSYVRNKIMPFLEGKVEGFRGRRLLLGTSMGGFNSAQLLFRDGKLFDRVALLSPAFITVGPYAPSGEINEYFSRHDSGFVGKFKIRTYLDLLRAEFKTPAAWAAHNPLDLIQSQGLPRGTKLYISGADEDNYGFQEGGELFAHRARSSGANVTWKLLNGGHKVNDPAGIARFLAQ